MPGPRIAFDRTEMILVDTEAKTPKVHNLSSEQIVRFRLVTRRAFAIYRFVEDQVIEVHIRGHVDPVCVRRRKNRSRFEEYAAGVKRFAEANQIPVSDENPMSR